MRGAAGSEGRGNPGRGGSATLGEENTLREGDQQPWEEQNTLEEGDQQPLRGSGDWEDGSGLPTAHHGGSRGCCSAPGSEPRRILAPGCVGSRFSRVRVPVPAVPGPGSSLVRSRFSRARSRSQPCRVPVPAVPGPGSAVCGAGARPPGQCY